MKLFYFLFFCFYFWLRFNEPVTWLHWFACFFNIAGLILISTSNGVSTDAIMVFYGIMPFFLYGLKQVNHIILLRIGTFCYSFLNAKSWSNRPNKMHIFYNFYLWFWVKIALILSVFHQKKNKYYFWKSIIQTLISPIILSNFTFFHLCEIDKLQHNFQNHKLR